MSIDIYFMFQSRQAGKWQDIACEYNGFHGGRDAALFAWLALGGGDERNSYALEPLDRPRGFPDDFAIVDQVFHPIADINVLAQEKRGYFQKRDMRVLMGHADFSQYLAYEVLKAEPPRALRAMAVPVEAYRGAAGAGAGAGAGTGAGTGAPLSGEPVPRGWKRHPAYAGKGYATPEEIDAATRFVVVESLFDFSGELAWFRDLLTRLCDAHGEVRFMFGFA